MPTSKIEETFALQLAADKVRSPEREYRFHPTRMWRLDFAWPQKKVGVECEGGVWSGGRHTTGSGFTSDCEKYNEAVLLGWRILRVTADMVKKGEALRLTKVALA